MKSPTANRDTSDPGDDVQRRFRYQHAYGVILLIGSFVNNLDYRALWCEQHEDFLAEISDTLFDAYQIKTKKSELGPWKLNDESFDGSMARFVALDERFPNYIRRFKFVSNTEPYESDDKKTTHLCPVRLVKAAAAAKDAESLEGSDKKGFYLLTAKTKVTADRLFAILKRFEFVVGPTGEAFEAEIAQDHLGKLPQCEEMSPAMLANIREALISQVALASSLYSDDPTRHYSAIGADYKSDSRLIAKRIQIEDVSLTLTEAARPEFQYLPALESLHLGAAHQRMRTLEQKMIRGGLAYHYEVMRRRALTAEQVLLDVATRPKLGKKALSQIENIVLAECDDARLRISNNPEPYGVDLLVDVQNRLSRIANEEPSRVHNQPADVLIGTAGLLSSECKLWWGQPFQLEATT